VKISPALQSELRSVIEERLWVAIGGGYGDEEMCNEVWLAVVRALEKWPTCARVEPASRPET